MSATYTLTWRHVTPKGVPTKTKFVSGLPLEDVEERLPELYPVTCWIYVERDDIEFRGKTPRTDRERA